MGRKESLGAMIRERGEKERECKRVGRMQGFVLARKNTSPKVAGRKERERVKMHTGD